jgi:glucan phosphoethanolaminetransferase (alkaline phosphatase superfamily)
LAKSSLHPVVRVAPLGELKVDPITEAELNELERGSAASVHLNFALFFLGIAIPLFFTIRLATFVADRTFNVFVIFFAVTLVAGLVFSILWFLSHRRSTRLADEIRGRMPPAPAIQESTEVVLSPPAQLSDQKG